MTNQTFSEVAVSISELKKNPMAAVASGKGFPIAVLNRNNPVFYCVPAAVYEAMLDRPESVNVDVAFKSSAL